MESPPKDAIGTFVAITGVSEFEAWAKLQDHHGDLYQAVDAYYNEKERAVSNTPQSVHANSMNGLDAFYDISDPAPYQPFPSAGLLDCLSVGQHQHLLSCCAKNHEPGVSHPRQQRGFFIESQDKFNHPSSGVSHPRQRREVFIESRDELSHPSAPGIEEITEHISEYHPHIEGIVTCDAFDDVPESHTSGFSQPEPSAPAIDLTRDYEIEEQMIKSAIEESKRELKEHPRSSPEKAMCEHGMQFGLNGVSKLHQCEHGGSKLTTAESSIRYRSDDENNDLLDDEPLIRHRGQGTPVLLAEGGSMVHNMPSSSPLHDMLSQHIGNVSTDELDDISCEEREVSLKFETLMIPVNSSENYQPQNAAEVHDDDHCSIIHPISLSPEELHFLKEEQDIEYLAALAADQDKDLNALKEWELRNLKETAALGTNPKKMLEDEDFKLQANQSSLPPEPSVDDKNALNLLIRMPDGSEFGCQFRKLDKLQFLFDYIDKRRLVKPGSYRLVRTYPQHSFGEGEIELTLDELGFADEQETLLLLEMI